MLCELTDADRHLTSLGSCAAAERCSYLQELCKGTKLTVKGYHKDTPACPLAGLKENIAVCSYEKGNSAINRMVAKNKIKDLCCVVVDEFHMIVDESRGSTLEVCLHSTPLHSTPVRAVVAL